MIKEILARLDADKRELLMYSFNNGKDVYVEYAPGLFIGVYCDHCQHLEITESAGVWSIGRIKE